MKNRILSSVVAGVFLSSLWAGILCFCVSGDCHSSFQFPPSITPSCHHHTAGMPSRIPAKKDCCGKCQIEKAAVVPAKLAMVLHAASVDGVSPVAEYPEKGVPVVFESWDPHGPPGSFFVQHVLGTTFSYSAPPVG